MNTFRPAILRLLPPRSLLILLPVLSFWVFLHTKSKFSVPHKRCCRNLQMATAGEAALVFLWRPVTQEDNHEEASMGFPCFVL